MEGGPSEPPRADEGVGEIDEEARGHEGAKRQVKGHGVPPSEPFAEGGVASRDGKEGHASGDEDDVEHGSLSSGPNDQEVGPARADVLAWQSECLLGMSLPRRILR